MDDVMRPDTKSISLLNIQYSVFLGVILNFSFFIDTRSNYRIVQPLVDLYGRPEFLVFAVYFVLDWFSANIMHSKQDQSPVHLLIQVVWIAILGATIISLNGTGLWKFGLLSFYVCISGVYDFWYMQRKIGDCTDGASVIGLILAAIRFTVGLAFLVPVLLAIIGRSDVIEELDNPHSWADLVFFVSVVYVFLKGIRFLYLKKQE